MTSQIFEDSLTTPSTSSELMFIKSEPSTRSSSVTSFLNAPNQKKSGGVPFEIVRAGDHCDLRMSKQMDPFELMLG